MDDTGRTFDYRMLGDVTYHVLPDPAVSHANWEETGILPDVEAYADWDTFTFETDPSVAAALTLLGHP